MREKDASKAKRQGATTKTTNEHTNGTRGRAPEVVDRDQVEKRAKKREKGGKIKKMGVTARACRLSGLVVSVKRVAYGLMFLVSICLCFFDSNTTPSFHPFFFHLVVLLSPPLSLFFLPSLLTNTQSK